MGDNSRCSVEHWEPKKWGGWPAFLRVGKETSYADRQWNHSPAQNLLSDICLRVRSPHHCSHWESFHWLQWAHPGAGSACGLVQEVDEVGGSESHLALALCTGWLLGELGAPADSTIFFSLALASSSFRIWCNCWQRLVTLCLMAGISCSNMGLDRMTSACKSVEQFLELFSAQSEHYSAQ